MIVTEEHRNTRRDIVFCRLEMGNCGVGVRAKIDRVLKLKSSREIIKTIG